MNLMVRNCSACEAPSSKRRLLDLPDGLFCSMCLPNGMTGIEAMNAESAYKERLENERNKPKPEGFGEWA